MATPNVGILTNAGKNLIDQVNAGKTKITFSKIVFSSMDNSQLSDMQVKALTAIAPQEVVVSSPETTLDTNSGETRIRATGTNEKLADGVYVKTYGVFAKDDNGSEILYGVTVSPNPNYFPAYDGVTPQAVTYSYKTVIQETSNITMTNSNDVYASQEDLTEAIAAIPKPDLSNYATDSQLATKADDSKVVHKTGDEEISGSKTFDTAPIDKTTGNPYITVTDLNNGLNTKVTDNKNGTEQLNGVQVQPFNKLSDSVGGRNYLINTQNPSATNPVKFLTVSAANTAGTVTFSNGYVKVTSTASSTASETFYRFATPISTLMPLPSGTYTLVVDLTSSDNVYIRPRGQYSTGQHYSIGGLDIWNDLSTPLWALSSTEKRFSYTFTIPSNTTGWYISFEMYADTNGKYDNTGKSFQFRNASIQKGDVVSDSPISPEDKVNVTDMRKPASDVAGIEEVNAKQDKIGYTPADDSKVAHLSGANNFDTVPTVKNNPLLLASSLPSDLARTSQQTNFTAGLQSGGVDVATAADLKSIEDASWRPLTLKNSNSGTILFKDNGNGTASLTGSANFTVAKGTKTLTPAITPPTGYIFTSLNWSEDSWNNNGVWVHKYMGSGSGGVPDSFDTIISNGVICFLGHDDNDNPITFSPSELTTVNNSTDCNPALVSISKV